jgi:sugar (pentulose or hexulose) kinase
MENVGFKIDGFNGIGGGCSSSVWIQIISDVTGKPLHVIKNHLEAGAAGTALTVAVGLGIYPNMDEVDRLIGINHEIQPNPTRWKRYDALYQEYRGLYELLAPVYRRLYQIQ